jgi:hypothetical protein
MSLYGAFDQTLHLDELDTPLVTNEGVLTPAQRRARVIANLFVSGDDLTFANDFTFSGEVDITGGDTDITTTSAAVANIEPLLVTTNISGAGATGGRAKFQTNITGALGGWSNALKGQVDHGTGGSTSGLGSAVVAELVMGPDTDTGTYAPLEIEFGFPDASVLGTAAAFINMTAYGDTEELAAFNDVGYLFDLQGITAGSGDMFQTAAVTGVNSTHALKIRIGATDYFVPLHTSATFAD